MYQGQHLPYENIVYQRWNSWDLQNIVENAPQKEIIDPVTSLKQLGLYSRNYLKELTNAMIVGDEVIIKDITQSIMTKSTGYIKGLLN